MTFKTRKVLLLLLFVTFCFFAFSQQDEHGFIDPRAAKEHFSHKNYLAAMKVYKELIKQEPQNVEYHYRLAQCYLYTHLEKETAITELKFVTAHNYDNEAWFDLGKAYHYANHFDDAIKAFTRFKEKADSKDAAEADREIEMCNNGKQLVKYPVNVTFENLGHLINTEFPDYYPFVPDDESFLIFTSRRAESMGGRKEMDGYYSSDIFISTAVNGKWTKPKNIGPEINTPLDEQAVGLTPDGNKMIIYLDHIDKFGDLYESDRKGKNFEHLYKLNENINGGFETAGSVSPDGNTFFFASERPGGLGETDIYMARKLPNGQWALPQNLGSNINTKYKEDFPRMSDDGKTLYFASQGHSSMGDFDIFKAEWNPDDNTWSEPVNLGYPINTSGDDRSICFTENNRVAYLSAVRDGGYGDYDIYRVTFNNTNQRYEIFTGKVNSTDSTIAISSQITAINTKTNDSLSFIPIQSSGKYVMALIPGIYNITITANGYKTISDKIIVFDIGTFKGETKKNYLLEKTP
ncbi:MAG: hypothetical protein ABI199_06840 [Bacteroidia bacterium]